MDTATLRKIDILVAQHLMGYWWAKLPHDERAIEGERNEKGETLVSPGFPLYEADKFIRVHVPIAAYSEMMDMAWKVAQRLTDEGWDFQLRKYSRLQPSAPWVAWFDKPHLPSPHLYAQASTMSPALSICLAALRARGVSVNKDGEVSQL